MKNQGKSKRQIENSYKIINFTFIGFIILIIITAISKTLILW